MCGSNFCVLFLIRFRHLRSFPFSFDQTMVSIRVQPLHSMASSQSHDHICQKAFSLSLFCVWTFQSIKKKKKKNGRDVTRASHTSRLYPGLYAVIKTMPRMWIQLLCACVLYSYGVTWAKTMVVTSISHMGEMRDSDWSRPNLLRSDWLPIIGAIMTTFAIYFVQRLSAALAPNFA